MGSLTKKKVINLEAFIWIFLLSLSIVHAREEINFDFAWRFRLGLHSPPPLPPPPSPAPPCTGKYAFHNKSGVQCNGLSHRSQGDKSASACEQQCCDDQGCAVWQWCDPAKTGCGCWMGICNVFNNNSIWVGGVRTAPYIPPTPAPWPPPANPDEAKSNFDDSSWEIIDVPHDSLINLTADQRLCPGGCSGRSYIPRYVGWYRKHFKVPASWSGSSVWIYFAGIFRNTIIYLNGKNLATHDCGYTSFPVRLDNAGLLYDSENVLAVYVDPNHGRSGWWYEGGGIYRHVRIIMANMLHIDTHGIFVHNHIDGSINSRRHPSLGLSAPSASLNASALVENYNGKDQMFCVRFSLKNSAGKLIATATSKKITIRPTSHERAGVVLPIKSAELWSIQRPYLYTVLSEVLSDCNSQNVTDSIITTTGIRSLDYSRNDEGFFMNEQHVKVRGFCDHNDFSSVGMAVPDRVNLFRAQAMRSVGGQGWRMSHNPADPGLLDILDRVGITVMDENRLFANSSEYIYNMGELVKRDRNHPSIIIWSFCNEGGCEGGNEQGGPAFYEITYKYDGSRPTLANMFSFDDLLGHTIDVQGFSHQGRSQVDKCHSKFPHKPIFMSECCSCNTQRGEDVGGDGVQRSFNAKCQQGQTNNSNGVPYVVGTMVWTLFDYYGEPSNGGWPFVSSTFGSFDLAGFAKAAVYWFRSYWLYQIPDTSADKTFSTGDSHIAHIVQGWEPPAPPGPPPPSMNESYVTYCDPTNKDYNQNISFSGSGSNAGLIKNYAGLCLDGLCTSLDCYPLPFVPCNPSKKSQLFKYANNVFTNEDNGGCLDVYGQAGPRVGIYKCNGANNQKWNITANTHLRTWAETEETSCLSDTSQGGGGSGTSRTIQAYTDAPTMDLIVNGKSLGVQRLVSPTNGGPSWAEWNKIPYVAGNITAVAMDINQKVLATHTVLTAGAASRIKLTLDSPSPTTGTGEALFLDGQDTALVRATIVDTKEELVRSSSHSIAFSIVSGPGRVVGTHNGDPQNHENNHSPKHAAYHGLVRAVIMVTEDHASPSWHRQRLSLIDIDGSIRTKIIAPSSHQIDTPTSIVVKATSPGLPSATIIIPLSTNPKDSVLGAAEKYGSSPVYFD